MKIPQLRKQPEKKSCHGYKWIDNYSWIHQDNCLEILRDTSKLNPEVRKYLDEENAFSSSRYFLTSGFNLLVSLKISKQLS